MSMRISDLKRRVAALVCLATLAGCAEAPQSMGFLDPSVFQDKDDEPLGVREAVLAGTVVVLPPERYCVDTETRRNRFGASFAVLAPCAGLKIPGIEWPETVAIMMVTATKGSLPAASASDLEALITSAEGLDLLSPDGNSAVQILQTESQQGAFFVRVAEADTQVDALESTYWRGFAAAGGRLVGLTVRGYKAEPLSAEAGLRLIRTLARDIRADSRGTAADAGRNTNSELAALFRNFE